MLVDTSVWIDFLTGRPGGHVELLESALTSREDICICGVILAEVLQGIREDRAYRETHKLFKKLKYLAMPREIYSYAAEIYRGLRKRGVTVRKPIDCMIAAVAIKNDVPLLHNDRDFEPIAVHFDLKTP